MDYCLNWRFHGTTYPTVEDFKSALSAWRAKRRPIPDQEPDAPDTGIAFDSPQLRICWDVGESKKATGILRACGHHFTNLDLLFQLHSVITPRNDGGHYYFEGLVVVNYTMLREHFPEFLDEYPPEDDIPTYQVQLGS